MNHFLPEEFTRPLSELQDQVPSIPYEKIRSRFQEEWTLPPDQLIENFARTAVASASTAQVHTGYYRKKKVAIKVLYPGIEDLIQKDLLTIYRISLLISKLLLEFPYKEFFQQLKELVEKETDLRYEQQNILKMKDLFHSHKRIHIPEVIRELSTGKILVTEFIEGKKINESQGPNTHGREKSEVLNLLVESYILMVFEFRFFHADPHPGNLIVTENGSLCLIDFGSVGVVEPGEESSLALVLESAIKKDYSGVLEGFRGLGVIRSGTDERKLLSLIEYSFQKLDKILLETKYFRNISIDTLDLKSDKEFLQKIQWSLQEIIRELNLPPNYISLQRVVALLVGIAALLDPYRSIFEYSEAPFREYLGRRFWRKLDLDFRTWVTSWIPKSF
jgi:ubiquinone biosynthesis protein